MNYNLLKYYVKPTRRKLIFSISNILLLGFSVTLMQSVFKFPLGRPLGRKLEDQFIIIDGWVMTLRDLRD